MKRFYSLSVDRLEDRSVPAVVTGATSPVIDVYLIDPNGLPANPVKPVDSTPIPGLGWSNPTDPVPPIDSPFWY